MEKSMKTTGQAPRGGNVYVEDYTPNILSGKRYDTLRNGGWKSHEIKWGEFPGDAIRQLAARHKDRLLKVKIYYMRTYVRGSYDTVILYKEVK